MRAPVNQFPTIVAALIFFGCRSTDPGSRKAPAARDEAGAAFSRPVPRARFLIVGKPLVANPTWRQEIAAEAVRKIAVAAGRAIRGSVVDALPEVVMTRREYLSGEKTERVTGAIFKARLAQLARSANPRDTVVLYTHSHGRKMGFEKLGGIVLDLPVRSPKHRGTLLWNEYAGLFLKIPAKNVVVLTMSCFSGGLVEYLESPKVKARWKDRRRKEGRNLIVLTSQSKDSMSNPIRKDGETINPFTYAVAKAFSGEADGFRLVGGKPPKERRKDGKITAGELIDYILYTTKNTASEWPRLENDAEPQVTGSFGRKDVLFILSQASRGSRRPPPDKP